MAEIAEWLIKKGEFYYRPKKSGYTTRKCEAGRYTERDARLEAEIEPWHMSAIHQDTIPDDYNFDTMKINTLERENRSLLVLFGFLILALSACANHHKQGDFAPDQTRALIALDKEFRQ